MQDPAGTAYALGSSADVALAAMKHSRIAATHANFAAHVVVSQAVFALKESGLSVRQIAAELSLSKSEVARRLKAGHHMYKATDDAIDRVVEAWNAARG